MTRAVSEAQISRAVKALTEAGHLPEVILEPGRATVRPMGQAARVEPMPPANDFDLLDMKR